MFPPIIRRAKKIVPMQKPLGGGVVAGGFVAGGGVVLDAVSRSK